jgi:hypothetical protein
MWPRRRLASSFGLCLLLFSAGCRNCDKVEAELRTRDRDLIALRDELYNTLAYNEALQHEVCALRGSPFAPVTPESASQTYTLQKITLGRQTGGYNNDDCPGDEALQVVIEPKDPDGHTIKAPGTVEVLALEISTQGTKTPLSFWTVPPDKLRKSWRSGLLSTGYSLILPWQNWPSTEKLRVVVRFKLPDNRIFEADKDVTVRLRPENKRKLVPGSTVGDPLDGSYPHPEEVPPPRIMDAPSLDAGWHNPPLSSRGLTSQWHTTASSPLSRAVQMLRPVPLK